MQPRQVIPISYSGSDEPVCDICLKPYPWPWPDGYIAPWPAVGALMEADGRATGAEAGSFHLCQPCLQAVILAADLPAASRVLAIRNAERWAMSQLLLAELKAIDRVTFAAEAAEAA